MSNPVITVENLSKKYTIRHQNGRHRDDGLRHLLQDVALAPWRWLRKVARPNGANGTGSSQSPISNLQSSTSNLRSASSEAFWALRDVNLEVKQGEVVGIIGRNGAGKSTLLKILSRITEPTEGQVRIKGRVASLLEVGTGFHPELTGRENIFLNGAILGMTRLEIKHKFDEIVAFAEIDKFLDTPVKRYSSGMYVRLAFAVAAYLEPEILIVDEVLAVGDAQFQRKCLGKIGQVSKDGRTVLFVSHNMAAVRKLCSHAFLLKKGRVHAGGPTNEIISTYLNAGNAEHLASIELPPGPPESPCRATRFQCLAMDGRPQADFRLYEPWRCKVEFEMFESVPNVVVAVGLINHESIPIITYWSQPKDLARGKYQVEFDCRVPLKACTLEFAVGISTYLRPIYYTEGIGHASISTVVASGKDPLIASGGGLLLSAQEAKIQAREC